MKLGSNKHNITSHNEDKKQYYKEYMRCYNSPVIYCDVCEKDIKKLQIYKHKHRNIF